jgi:hypothetical protein
MAAKRGESEVEAYGFIRETLRELGWNLRNPSASPSGQVWTQNQCLSHPEIKAALGAARPENIVKISEACAWVIEAKADRKQLTTATREAMRDYADLINKKCRSLRAVLATGVAGTDETGYLVESHYWDGTKWHEVTINRKAATGLLSPEDVRRILEAKSANIEDFKPPHRLFLQAAEEINRTLHLGGINKNDRAKVIAALLLSVIESPPNLETDLPVLIGEINARSEDVLKKNGKVEFAPFVKIIPPTNTTNHKKYKTALVQTLQILLDLNIRSAMNSRSDILGQFYEVFLKYGNGAKEIGIVLTPRHVTRFAVEVLGVNPTDIVFDPACGTGGFLVAAFDYVRGAASEKELDRFKKHNLFGLEQESYVAILAIVNMIFRGDGKNNIIEANCFDTYLVRKTINGDASAAYSKKAPSAGDEPVTRVLMNPPFSLKGSHDKEHRFVTHALTVMRDGALLFSLLPMDCMFGSGEERVWRQRDILEKHTLMAVISFPDELFYPAALKQVIGIIVKRGIPHPNDAPVFWGRVARDGHIKLKSRRLLASELEPPRQEPNDMEPISIALRSFLANPSGTTANVPLLYKSAAIDFSDPQLELLPEAYIDTPAITSEELAKAMDVQSREIVAFVVRYGDAAKGGQ